MQHRQREGTTRPSARQRHPAGALEAPLLTAIARAVAAAEAYWRPLVQHDPASRRFVRLRRTPTVEAWLLTWTTEQGIDLHDHGGSSGAVLVVDGELTEDFTDLATHAPLRQGRIPRGRVHCFGPGHVHDLNNRSGEFATSIHVYSPPLTSMTFYRRDDAGLLVPARVEPVAATQPAALALAL